MYHWVNRPQMADGINIPNPKDIIENALPRLGALQNDLLARKFDTVLGHQNNTLDDLGEVYSLPVFMIQSAVEAMAEAKQMGEAEEEKEELDILMKVLAVVLAVLPFADSFVPALEVPEGFFFMASTLTNAALTGYEIAENPSQAPLLIISFVMGLIPGGAGRDEGDLPVLAKGSRAMSDDERAALGGNFKKHDDERKDVTGLKCMA